MPSNTPNLALYKKNPATDGADTFNIDTMLNENWDKLDAAAVKKTGDTMSGTLTVPSLTLSGGTATDIDVNGNVKAKAGTVPGSAWNVIDYAGAPRLTVPVGSSGGPVKIDGNTVWNAGNDGAGSGLDADLFDGAQSVLFARLASPALTGTPTAPTAAARTNTIQIATTAFVETELQRVPEKTTADITLYVNATTGNDANSGLTAGTALKTIGSAIAKIPQIVNHVININVADGTYAEEIAISGFVGKGDLNLIGNKTVPTNVSITALTLAHISIMTTVRGITALSTVGIAFQVYRCNHSFFDSCRVTAAAASYVGFFIDGSTARVMDCVVSNRSSGVYATYCATVFSYNTTGSGNTVGLLSDNASTIGKSGQQPAGTTAEQTGAGGIIR